MGSRRGSVMGMYIDTSEFLNIQLVIQLSGGTSEGMQACSEFFQCSEGFFDWTKKIFIQKSQKYEIDFHTMTKSVHQ